MCGRYWIEEKGKRIRDICPSDRASVIGEREGEERIFVARWGYPAPGSSGLVINARAETVLEKKLFQNGIRNHRIVVPAAGFYEWNRNREKYSFRQGNAALYMAGFEDIFENEHRFVILTTAANASMEPVHDRMPLILEENQIKDWICENSKTEELLKKTPPLLEREGEYEQMKLDLFI